MASRLVSFKFPDEVYTCLAGLARAHRVSRSHSVRQLILDAAEREKSIAGVEQPWRLVIAKALA